MHCNSFLFTLSNPSEHTTTANTSEKTDRVYQFDLPNERVLIYQVFAYCIIFINMLLLLLMDYKLQSPNLKISIIVCAALFVALMLWDRYLLKHKNRLQSLGIIILILGFRWYQYEMGWAFLVNVVLWFLYLISKRKLSITITEEMVRYPSFPEKKINWAEISNLILKDGMLTIDLKNNKVYQHYIKDADAITNEQDFNEFCNRQLEQNR